MLDAPWLRAAGTSPEAISHHYDLPADFFALWLGEERIYSCALWSDDPAEGLHEAQHRKLDFFANQLRVTGARVLDIGCGWGALLDRFVRVNGAAGFQSANSSARSARTAAGSKSPTIAISTRAGP